MLGACLFVPALGVALKVATKSVPYGREHNESFMGDLVWGGVLPPLTPSLGGGLDGCLLDGPWVDHQVGPL